LTERLVPSTQLIRGEEVHCEIKKWACAGCGAAFMSPAQATEAVKHAVAVYQVKHDLMTADRIRSGRKKNRLTAGELATKAKVGIVTIKRLEAGTTVQKPGTNKLLEIALCNEPELPEYEITLNCSDFATFCEVIPAAWSCEKSWSPPTAWKNAFLDDFSQENLKLLVG
jgi:transcriptional regulator with XRE-family HTH domain